MSAVEPPPPLQIAAHPYCPGRSKLINVTKMRQPEAPIGCPSETAPPAMLIFSGSIPRI